MFKSTGIIKYNPARTLKTNVDWWCVLEVSEEIGRYYRWHIDKMWWEADSKSFKRSYNRPPHKAHISIIRGERPTKNIDLWGKFLPDKLVTFEYDGNVRQTSLSNDGKDHFWFIDTHFREYNLIRSFFGLKTKGVNDVPFKGHLTVARSF